LAGLTLAHQLLLAGKPADQIVVFHQNLPDVTGSTNPGGLLNPVPGASLNPKPGTLTAFEYSIKWIEQFPQQLREACRTDIKLLRPYSLAIQPGRRLFKSFKQSQAAISRTVGIRHLDNAQLQESYPHLQNCDGAIEFARAATLPMHRVGEHLERKIRKAGVHIIQELAQQIIPVKKHWTVQSQTQTVETQKLVFASGPGLFRFFPGLPLRATSGHLARITMPEHFPVTHAISGRGHLCPMADGSWIIGATYHQEGTPEPEADSELRKILLSKIGHWVQESLHANWLETWRGVRAVISPEKQPLVGSVPNHPGLFTLGGFASRGLQWAPYCAHQLAKHLVGEPLALPETILNERLTSEAWTLKTNPAESPNFAKLGF
jgi:glycine/D-amino acid oxidase-like deaminating enzyme